MNTSILARTGLELGNWRTASCPTACARPKRCWRGHSPHWWRGARIKSRAGPRPKISIGTHIEPTRTEEYERIPHLTSLSGRESRQDHHDSPSPSTHTAGPVTTTSRPTAQDLPISLWHSFLALDLQPALETLPADQREARTARQTIAPAKPTPNPSSSRT